MAKNSKEMRMKIDKMTLNVNQRIIVKELEISRSGISEIIQKFQGTGNDSNRLTFGHPRNLSHSMVQKLIMTGNSHIKKIAG